MEWVGLDDLEDWIGLDNGLDWIVLGWLIWKTTPVQLNLGRRHLMALFSTFSFCNVQESSGVFVCQVSKTVVLENVSKVATIVCSEKL